MCNGDSLPPCEEEVLNALAADDMQRAFDILLQCYADKVVGYCVFKVGHQQDGEDVAQDVFLAIHKALPRYKGTGTVRNWVFGIARKRCQKHWWKFWNRGRLFREKTHLIESSMAPEPPAKPDEEYDAQICNVQRADDIELVRKCLTLLDEQSRTLLLMRYYEGLSYRAIAQRLWTSDATVRRKIEGAIKQVKRCLYCNKRDE